MTPITDTRFDCSENMLFAIILNLNVLMDIISRLIIWRVASRITNIFSTVIDYSKNDPVFIVPSSLINCSNIHQMIWT